MEGVGLLLKLRRSGRRDGFVGVNLTYESMWQGLREFSGNLPKFLNKEGLSLFLSFFLLFPCPSAIRRCLLKRSSSFSSTIPILILVMLQSNENDFLVTSKRLLFVQKIPINSGSTNPKIGECNFSRFLIHGPTSVSDNNPFLGHHLWYVVF